MVVFFPFIESLCPWTGGAPPTAADMLAGPDALADEEGDLVARGSEVRPEAANSDPVAGAIVFALEALKEVFAREVEDV
jgi:hypothetical protein